MATEKSLPSSLWSVVLRYGLAVSSATIALGISLLMAQYGFRVGYPLFLMAVIITVWYGGTGPAIVAIVLSTLAFDYFFTEPLHSFYVTRYDLPLIIIFVLFASLIAWFSAIRRRAESNLRQSRDDLRKEVTIRSFRDSRRGSGD